MRAPKLFQTILSRAHDTATAQFQVQGMTCNHCAERVRKSVETLPGIKSADIDLKTGNATITYRPDAVSVEQVLKQILATGYTASVAPKPAE